MDKEKTKEEYLNSISQEEKKRYYKIAFEVLRRKKRAKAMDDDMRQANYAIDTGGSARLSDRLKEKYIQVVLLEKVAKLEIE